MLIIFNYDQEFILATDASDIGVGGVLMQERNGQPQPIAYASRLCTSSERNYSVTERETLAVIYCLNHFLDIILGYKIRVWTDHTAIQNLFKYKNLRGRLARWFVTLQNFDVAFEYIPGKRNTAADALSRNIMPTENEETVLCNIIELTQLDENQIMEEQRRDEVWKEVIDYLENPSSRDRELPRKIKIDEYTMRDRLLYRHTELKGKEVSREACLQLVIPQKFIKHVIELNHDSSTSSHPGKEKTYRQIQLKYFWPGMRSDIYSYVENCQICETIKGRTQAPAPMLSYPIPDKPWKRVHLDTLELPLSQNGYKYLFVAIDYFSRFAILKPIRDKKAETIAAAIFEEIIVNFTTPHTIITDNGGEFNNKILEELCQTFKVKKVNIQAYHPASNGVVERLNRTVINCLRSLIDPHSITWDVWIPHVKCAINTHINSATGDTPHYIIFGEDKSLPFELLKTSPSPLYNPDDYMLQQTHNFQQIYSRVKKHMKVYREELQKQQHKQSREVKIKIGDVVMAKLHVPVADSNKLSPRFTGPYKVIETAGGNKLRIQNIETGEVYIRHVDDLKQSNMQITDGDTPRDQTDEIHHNDRPDEPIGNAHNDDLIDDTNECHIYRKKLRSHAKEIRYMEVDPEKDPILCCNITTILLEDEFYQYVDELLRELGVDVNSFYR